MIPSKIDMNYQKKKSKIDMFVSFIYNTYIQTVATHSILATKKHPYIQIVHA